MIDGAFRDWDLSIPRLLVDEDNSSGKNYDNLAELEALYNILKDRYKGTLNYPDIFNFILVTCVEN